MRTMIAAVLAAVTLTLSGCGGGGGGSDETAQGCTPSMADPDACAPKLQLVLTDAAGAETTQVSPDSAGVLRAVLKDGDGAPIPNVVVTFTSTDKGGAFVPASGTALTGAGRYRVCRRRDCRPRTHCSPWRPARAAGGVDPSDRARFQKQIAAALRR